MFSLCLRGVSPGNPLPRDFDYVYKITEELGQHDWQPKPNLLNRVKNPDLNSCIRSRRTKVTSAQRLAATSKVAPEFMRACHTHSKRTKAFRFTTSLQKKKRKADVNGGIFETALSNEKKCPSVTSFPSHTHCLNMWLLWVLFCHFFCCTMRTF